MQSTDLRILPLRLVRLSPFLSSLLESYPLCAAYLAPSAYVVRTCSGHCGAAP